MAKTTIIVGTKTISITDTKGNNLTVVKTQDGLEFHSKIETATVTPQIIALQTTIRNIVLNPNKTKDSFYKRFNRIANFLKSIDHQTFKTLGEKLQAENLHV